MSDDTTRGDEDEDGKPDVAALRRRQAEGTASDLARMGIDPRSLGLSAPGEARESTPQQAPEVDDTESAQVVPLRPGIDLARASEPLLPPGAPVEPKPGPDEDRTGPPAGPSRSGPSTSGPGGDAPSRPHDAVEQLLGRTARTSRPPRQTGRLLKAVTRGITTADAAESIVGDREVVEAVRHRQSGRRVVAFVAGKGGVGCTTAAVGTGTSFAALREDRSVVVDVQQGAAPLSSVLGGANGIDLVGAGSLDLDTPVPAAPSGLGLVDSVEWDLTVTRRDLTGALERLGADHVFSLLDAGDSAGEAAHAALARADQVVAVTGAGGLGLAALQTVLDRVRQVNPVAAGRVVHVVVCQHEETYRTVHREVVSQLGREPMALVVVPPDPHLAQGHPYDPSQVTAATREAFVRVAAAVALGAAR